LKICDKVLYEANIRDFYRAGSIINVMRARRVRWTGHVEKREKMPLGR